MGRRRRGLRRRLLRRLMRFRFGLRRLPLRGCRLRLGRRLRRLGRDRSRSRGLADRRLSGSQASRDHDRLPRSRPPCNARPGGPPEPTRGPLRGRRGGSRVGGPIRNVRFVDDHRQRRRSRLGSRDRIGRPRPQPGGRRDRHPSDGEVRRNDDDQDQTAHGRLGPPRPATPRRGLSRDSSTLSIAAHSVLS